MLSSSMTFESGMIGVSFGVIGVDGKVLALMRRQFFVGNVRRRGKNGIWTSDLGIRVGSVNEVPILYGECDRWELLFESMVLKT